MSLLCLGLSHHTAPVSLLEAFTFGADQLGDFLVGLCAGGEISEAAGLSTCNRTEFYIETPEPERARTQVIECLARARGFSPSVVTEHIYLHEGTAAVRHQFRVACGLDSLVVGELQILGQLREAMELAESAGTARQTIGPLLMRAIRAGRRARAETGIGRGNVSVASVAVSIAQKVFTDLSRKKVLMIGAGETARLALTNLAAGGVGSIVVANRNFGRGELLAECFGGQAVGLDCISGVLPEADIIIAATGSPEFLITNEMIVSSRRKGQTQVYLDLSLPRNIDPKISSHAQVFLYGIEDLEGLAKENRAQREGEIGKVEAIIDEEVRRFLHSAGQADARHIAAALRRRTEETRRQFLARHGRQLSPETLDKFDRLSQSMMKSVLHDLTINLRRIDAATETGQAQLEIAGRLLELPVSQHER